MQFFYHKDSGKESITLEAKDSHYLFIVRRFKQNSTLLTSNLTDNKLYTYKHERKNTFTLISTHNVKSTKKAHTNILLAMIDQKDIYDILPTLNALNVASLQLFYADFSQRNRKIDMQKAQKILQYSCMQCGRMKPLELALHNNLESVCTKFPKSVAIDFVVNESLLESMQEKDSNKHIKVQHTFENLSHTEKHIYAIQGIIIGCEGGFSKRERDFIHSTRNVYALQIPYILTSHLTSTYIASLCI